MDGKILTIFTPTYNRASLLKRVYDSLLLQNDDRIMWLIVDDGSTDNTKEVVDEFVSEGKLDIIYKYRENGGKMRAHNMGVSMCETELFLCLDSDDWLNEGAALEILTVYDGIADKSGIAGIVAHKGKSASELLTGVEFPDGINRSALYNLYLHGFKGETTLVFRTEVIKKYPFPEIEGEKYVPEDYIYDKIDKDYEYIVVPKIITICELMENGYTDSVKKLKHDNKIAFYLYYEQRAVITPLSLLKIKYSGFYVKYAKLAGKPVFRTELPILYIIIGVLAEKFIKE